MTENAVQVHEDVFAFNKNVLGIGVRPVGLQSFDEYQLSVIQLREEINEFIEAYENGDVLEAGDAMIDLVYFALGVFYKMGLPFEEMWSAVHSANWQKKAGVKPGRDMEGDATKPEGWKPPNHLEIVKNFLQASGQLDHPLLKQ